MNSPTFRLLIQNNYIRVLLVFAIAVWCIIAVFHIYFVQPLDLATKAVQQDLINAKNDYAFRQHIASQSIDWEKYFDAMDRFASTLEVELKSSDVIFHLSDLFNKHSIDVVTESYTKIRKRDDHYYMEADIKGSSSYKDIQQLLNDLNSQPLFSFVTRLSLIKSDASVASELQIRIVSRKGDDR